MIIIFLSFIVLIFFSAESSCGIHNGMELVWNVFLPSVFPYLLLTNIIISLHLEEKIGAFFYPVFHKIFHCNKCTSYAIFTGLICGYPLGAFTLQSLYARNKVTRTYAICLLSLINNPSLGFLSAYVFGYYSCVSKSIFLISYYLPILLVGFIVTGRACHLDEQTEDKKQADSFDTVPFSVSLLNRCIFSTIHTVIQVSVYIILFSMFSNLLSNFLMKYKIMATLCTCALEITNGIHILYYNNWSWPVKLSVTYCALHFGGLSAIGQTKSVLSKDLQDIKNYLLTKLLLSFCSATLIFIFYLAHKY